MYPIYVKMKYSDLEKIMHGVVRHTRDIYGGKKFIPNVLSVDEVCYWEILNALDFRLKSEYPYFSHMEGFKDWRSEEINKYMQEYRKCLLPDFDRVLKGSNKPHVLDVKKLNLPEIEHFDNKIFTPFLINHFAGLYGYEVVRNQDGKRSELDALRDLQNERTLTLEPRKDGKKLEDFAVRESIIKKINSAELLYSGETGKNS